MKTPDTKIGVTLFNLRDYCKTEKDLDETLSKVKKIGYEAVQISGIGPIAPDKVKALLDKYNLYCCATHESMNSYENDFENIVKKLKTWECDFTALGSPGNDFWSHDGVADFAVRMERIGEKFKAEGITFGFHNHHREFVKFSDKTFIEELFDKTTSNVFAELDVHWIQRGGADPIEWIRKMDGRTSVLHFKDFTLKYIDGQDPVPEFSEIGEGNLNWKGIVKACEDTNVRWYVVEQDRPRGDRDIFDSIKISFDNMKAMGIK